ncbi:hypothetical protein ACA910_013018 [Epithemia clementina (nom. ined.)]
MGNQVPSKSNVSESSSSIIDSLLAERQVVMFCTTWCGYCDISKKLLLNLKASNLVDDFAIIDLDLRPDGNKLQQALVAKTGQNTVPNIFVCQAHLGGNEDIQRALTSGSLFQMLDKCRRREDP